MKNDFEKILILKVNLTRTWPCSKWKIRDHVVLNEKYYSKRCGFGR